MKTVLALVLATAAISASADTLMIQRASNGAMVFSNFQLPEVGAAPMKLGTKQIRDYIASCSKANISTMPATTEQSATVSQPLQDVVLVELKIENLERMDTVQGADCAVQLPTISKHESKQTFALLQNETRSFAAAGGEAYTITRIASKK
jgi:hypothetical protein